MSKSWKTLIATGAGVTGLAALAGVFAFGKFKQEEFVDNKHKNFNKPPMYLIGSEDDKSQSFLEKDSTLVMPEFKQVNIYSKLLMPLLEFNHPCAQSEMKFSSNQIPIHFEVESQENGNWQIKMKLDLKHFKIEFISKNEMTGDYHVFQEHQCIKTINQLEGNHEAIFILSVENYWFPAKNFTFYLLHRFKFKNSNEIECNDARIDFQCLKNTNHALELHPTNIGLDHVMAGSSFVKKFNFDNFSVEMVPVLSKSNKGKFHLFFSFANLNQSSFIVENVSTDQKGFVISMPKNNLKLYADMVYRYWVDKEDKIHAHALGGDAMMMFAVIHLEENDYGLKGYTRTIESESLVFQVIQDKNLNFSIYQRKILNKNLDISFKHCFETMCVSVEYSGEKRKSMKIVDVKNLQTDSKDVDNFLSWLSKKYNST